MSTVTPMPVPMGIPNSYARGGLSMTGYVEANIGSNANASNVRGVEAMRCDSRSNTAREGKQPATGKALLRVGCVVALFAAIFYGCFAVAQDGPSKPLYLDPSQPIDDRVNDLISRMTLKEKVGQLNLPCAFVDQIGKTIPQKSWTPPESLLPELIPPRSVPAPAFLPSPTLIKQNDVAAAGELFQ